MIRQENLGPSVARNVGLSHAKGEYVCFIDSDDYYRSDYLEELHRYITLNDISICGYKIVDFKDTILKNCICDNEITRVDVLANYVLQKQEISGYLWNKMFKRKIIRDHNIKFNPSIYVGEDLLFVLEYLSVCKTGSIISKALYAYCYNEGSLSHKFSEKNLSLLEVYSRAYKLFDDKIYKKQILQSIILHYLTFYELYNDKNAVERIVVSFMKENNITDKTIVNVLPKTDRIKYNIFHHNKKLYLLLMKLYRIMKTFSLEETKKYYKSKL